MLIPNKHSGYSKDGIRLYPIDGGGGGGPSTSTTNTSNIPTYAKPYVETMLGSAQNELFDYETDAEGNKTPTGLKGYRAFGGEYDEAGNQTGYDVDKYFAGHQPLQEQAYGSAKDLGASQQTKDASTLAANIADKGMNTEYKGTQFENAYKGVDPYAQTQFNQQTVSAPTLQNYQMGPAEQVTSQNFGGQSAQDYMSPYMQNVVDTQQAAAQRQSDIDATSRGANAARSGAYGGSRQAVMDAEAARSLASQKGTIQAQGLQNAYQQAQAQFNADQGRRQTAEQANQQAGLTVGTNNLNANLGVQSLGAGQSMEAQKANQATNLDTQRATEQSKQYGYGQGMTNAANTAQYGQAANALNANQEQFGADLGIKGLSVANQAASTLGGLGQQEFNQEREAIDLQNRLGTQQQGFEQGKVDQQIKDYANEQQFPMQQLGNMSNLLRGLPMQSTTTQTYQAAPSGVSQLAGAGTAAVAGAKLAGMRRGGKVRSGLDHLGVYNAMNK